MARKKTKNSNSNNLSFYLFEQKAKKKSMLQIVKLYKFLQKEHISLENFPLPKGIKGHYCKINGQSIINIDPNLRGDEEYYTTAFELGRHITESANISIPTTEAERMQYEKEKAKTSQWTAKNFVAGETREQLKQRLNENPPPNFDELVEEFNIPPRILVFVIHDFVMSGEVVPEDFNTEEGIEQGFENLKKWTPEMRKTMRHILIHASLRLIRETLNRNIKPREDINV